MKIYLSRQVSADLRRRHALRYLLGGICVSTAPAVLAHTPYGQWKVYRRKHLLVGCHKDASGTYALAKEIVGVLDEHLPQASARVARAPTAQRIASLMATDQMDVAVMSVDNANDMAAGVGKFNPYGKVSLNSLLLFDDWVLVCREDVPDRHAWLITDALMEGMQVSDKPVSVPDWHAGAQLRRHDKPMPD